MKNVLVLDSGSGGVNMLKSFTRAGIFCNFLMFCDQKNLPYGKKSVDELEKITIENLKNICTFFRFEIVVLACNTLSCTVLESCRKNFKDVTFIGTVPAVKPAIQKYDPKDVLVIGTEVTLSQSELIRKTKDVQLLPVPELATLIDENLDDLSVLKPFLQERLQGKNFKALVLGCTHYVAIKDILSQITGAEIFDSSAGVTKRLESFVSCEKSEGQVQFMVTGDTSKLPLFFWYYQN